MEVVSRSLAMYKLRGLDPSMQTFPFVGTVQTVLPVLGTSVMVRSQVPRLSVERSEAGDSIFVAGTVVSLAELSPGSGEGGSSFGLPRLGDELRWLNDDGNLPPLSVKQIIESVEELMDRWLWVVYQMESGNRAVRPALLYQYWSVSQCLQKVVCCPDAAVGKLLKLYGTVLFCTDLWKCVESYTVKRFIVDIGGSLMRIKPDTEDLLVFGSAPGFAAVRVSDLARALNMTAGDLLVEMKELMTEELVSLVYVES